MHLQVVAELIGHLAKFFVAELDPREGIHPDWMPGIGVGSAAWNDMPVKVSNVDSLVKTRFEEVPAL